jgi:hypothetical protein
VEQLRYDEAVPSPRDPDILLIVDEPFEVERVGSLPQAVFDSTRTKIAVSWRMGSGPLRYFGIGVAVIQTDEQMLLAQQCAANLRNVLLEARKVHSPQDYLLLAEPILLEVQQREQAILEYLSSGIEQRAVS